MHKYENLGLFPTILQTNPSQKIPFYTEGDLCLKLENQKPIFKSNVSHPFDLLWAALACTSEITDAHYCIMLRMVKHFHLETIYVVEENIVFSVESLP